MTRKGWLKRPDKSASIPQRHNDQPLPPSFVANLYSLPQSLVQPQVSAVLFQRPGRCKVPNPAAAISDPQSFDFRQIAVSHLNYNAAHRGGLIIAGSKQPQHAQHANEQQAAPEPPRRLIIGAIYCLNSESPATPPRLPRRE